jgi:hypothetical protein
MTFALTYQDYVSSHPGDATGGSEGGQGTSSLMPEDAWNNLSDKGKWNEVGNGIILTPADPRYADLAKELGVTNGRQIIGGVYDPNEPLDNKYLVDTNKVSRQGNVLFTPDENLTPFAQKQGGVADWFWPVGFIAGAAGGAALANAGILSGTAVTGAEATAAGGFATGADIAGTAGAATTAGSATGAAAAPGAGAEVGPPASLAPDPVAPPPGAEVGPPASLAPEPGAVPPGGAPVTDVSVPAQGPAPVTDVSVPAQNGIIDGARSTVGNGINWYNRLSPGSRLILGQLVSGGARGVFTAVAQHSANQAAIEAEDRHRQDVIRQGQVPLLPPGTFTLKNPGG